MMEWPGYIAVMVHIVALLYGFVGYQINVRRPGFRTGSLDLAFDVNLPEGCIFGHVEQARGFPGKQ